MSLGSGEPTLIAFRGAALSEPAKATGFWGIFRDYSGRRGIHSFKMHRVFLFCISCFGAFGQTPANEFVIANGRIIDPESHLDGVRQIAIRGGKITAIAERGLIGKRAPGQQVSGTQVIEAHGLIVSPGFIDLHSHGQDEENYRLKAMDGVTTALEMEVGVSPVQSWYAARVGNAIVNYGASVGHIPARMRVMHDSGTWLPHDRAANAPAGKAEQQEILQLLRTGLDEGALGVGMGIAYVPAASREEILDVFRVAAERMVPCFVHMRNPGPVEPGVIDSLEEVLALAVVTGAPLHVVHLPSMALNLSGLCLDMIHGARRRGIDVSTEAYPYTAGMTRLDSAVFDPGWQQRLAIGYGDLQWVETGERLTATTFAQYRARGGMVIIHNIPESAVRQALADPLVIIASDGRMEAGKGHPRGAGTYSRVLGRYVREQSLLSLAEALRKMTLLPAQRLESVSAAMRNKGRIRVGADADLAIFDPRTILDRATYENPSIPSQGMRYVFVNGVLVVRNGELVDGAHPGRGIRSR